MEVSLGIFPHFETGPWGPPGSVETDSGGAESQVGPLAAGNGGQGLIQRP